MPELRQNFFTKEWVIIATERAIAPASTRACAHESSEDSRCDGAASRASGVPARNQYARLSPTLATVISTAPSPEPRTTAET